jgi:hypothetical protein
MVAAAFAFIVAIDLEAQRGPAPGPLVREGVTGKIGDANGSLVPNVGIVVGFARDAGHRSAFNYR